MFDTASYEVASGQICEIRRKESTSGQQEDASDHTGEIRRPENESAQDDTPEQHGDALNQISEENRQRDASRRRHNPPEQQEDRPSPTSEIQRQVGSVRRSEEWKLDRDNLGKSLISALEKFMSEESRASKISVQLDGSQHWSPCALCSFRHWTRAPPDLKTGVKLASAALPQHPRLSIETWRNPFLATSYRPLKQHFQLTYLNDAETRVCFHVHKRIDSSTWSVSHISKDLSCLTISRPHHTNHIRIFNVYNEVATDMLSVLANALGSMDVHDKLLVLGDFNLHHPSGPRSIDAPQTDPTFDNCSRS
ncbi:hypothetical protein CONLIGDRAFT_687296 [Coniochaeta ligniaria NRRL 30616]|uniref:Endonuclease/exonuclease/phosphatase domain-containing protein n=1 Tax=Coniochaeta ligniaria NRRL 30616 TaxID=1408157 RepID=A0A1J7I5K3_9PEZI|nr:hypothetical protein CONLIGDRAFT_687296 [Coniochaeta ligniaria NRRL 30616]